jgi:hypothetical protein
LVVAAGAVSLAGLVVRAVDLGICLVLLVEWNRAQLLRIPSEQMADALPLSAGQGEVAAREAATPGLLSAAVAWSEPYRRVANWSESVCQRTRGQARAQIGARARLVT